MLAVGLVFAMGATAHAGPITRAAARLEIHAVMRGHVVTTSRDLRVRCVPYGRSTARCTVYVWGKWFADSPSVWATWRDRITKVDHRLVLARGKTSFVG